MFRVLAACLLLALISQSGVLFAEVIYKSVGNDGVVTYSDTPPPGAVKTETIQVETLSPEERRAVLMLRTKKQTQDSDILERLRAKEEEWRQIDNEILSAQAALNNAETALDKGRAPESGETRGTAGGFTRLTESYFQRLETMEQAVKEARDRLDKAYQATDQLM